MLSFNLFLEEKRKPIPKWKRDGPDGEEVIQFSSGRKFRLEKQYDENIRQKKVQLLMTTTKPIIIEKL